MTNGSQTGSARAAGDSLDVREPWTGAPDALTPTNLDRWYSGPSFDLLPDRQQLAARGPGALLAGWRPEAPIIGSETRVMGLGSCFASYFLMWLAQNGFNRRLDTSPHNALVRYGSAFENPAVIAQQFRWAFEGLDAASLKWIGKDKEVFEATEERRSLVRGSLEQTDVLIITLGLSEVWYDRVNGEPLWRALTRKHYEPDRHVFRVETLAGTKAWLERIETLRERNVPSMKIVFTVSPVRLKATFRPVSAITANSASKAILRAALDEFLREQGDKLNRTLFYFPSFEIVHDYFADAFEDDNRHVTPYVAAQVVRCFAENYCDASVVSTAPAGDAGASGEHARFLAASSAVAADPAVSASAVRIAELEKQVAELQQVCRERLSVIEGLDAAARERLELVKGLDAECRRLRELAASGRRG